MDRIIKLSYLLVFLIIPFSFVQGQDVHVEGYFLQDSAKLGERVGYVLKSSYPSELPIIFPDSTYDFGDFEFLDKQIFTSFTEDSITLDSAVYWISNFSLDSIQAFKIPVYEVLNYDSISHYPQPASLALTLTIEEIPEELVFEQNNSYLNIPQAFNYPYLIIGIVAVVILVVLAILLFGKGLIKRWKAYRERKKWNKFESQWESSMQQLINQPGIQEADELLGLWKNYLENLTEQPYKEWTSTEIAEHLNKPEIIKDFRKIELIIYANRVDDNIREACDNLLKVSVGLLEEKIDKILNHD
ncbi:hypothetical protein [Cyclobacterium marinum]|uniref:Uncharacterized protein n=1 Tax=Cyclobacterium marinum (strain ATCC 25205 / DSM 745 / LMG 13164 / NCIMB 1802) TaxID=880070 RepID=G0J4N9_CYCMS|nr:hypothetical protein [Cyclobacterium marinum]AEL24704.1 hypothetical protein Cycma_0932 [Cyclobacterium marinum DSM 745]MBR9773538.1 hypothetical protein [Cytophagales bacterium]